MCDNKAKRFSEIKISSSDCFAAVRFFFFFLVFFSANELLNGVRPVGAFSQLVLGGAALSAYSTVTIFICIMGWHGNPCRARTASRPFWNPSSFKKFSEAKLCKNDQLFKCTRGDRPDLRSGAPPHIQKVTRSRLGLHLYECKAAATFNPYSRNVLAFKKKKSTI